VSNNSIPVSVQILDKEYLVACTPEEKDTLLETSRHLDEKMREIRDGGKIIGTDRIAVMAALNITHELLEHQKSTRSGDIATSKRFMKLQSKIENALSTNKQLEF
jgi:cell division protein ZapA